MTITVERIPRAANACPTTWCDREVGHDIGRHLHEVASMALNGSQLRVELEALEGDEGEFVNIVPSRSGLLDDLTVTQLGQVAAVLKVAAELAAFAVEAHS
jgi:hypothetical protein